MISWNITLIVKENNFLVEEVQLQQPATKTNLCHVTSFIIFELHYCLNTSVTVFYQQKIFMTFTKKLKIRRIYAE
jgi:hypothetical protein